MALLRSVTLRHGARRVEADGRAVGRASRALVRRRETCLTRAPEGNGAPGAATKTVAIKRRESESMPISEPRRSIR